MTAVTESDPREGLGEALQAFCELAREKGLNTRVELQRIAKGAEVSLSTVYRWAGLESTCRNRRNAKDVRRKIEQARRRIEKMPE